jgi:TolB protein
MVLEKVYEGDSRNWRAMVHRFADEILYALTGERGVFDSKIAYYRCRVSPRKFTLWISTEAAPFGDQQPEH